MDIEMKKWRGKISMLLIGLMFSGVAFAALLWIERQSLKDLEKKPVARCIRLCPAGEEITGENVQEYFEIVQVAAALATAQTYGSLDGMLGSYPSRTIEAGEIVYSPVLSMEAEPDRMLAPVELSITADIALAVAGRIRKGDTVNVYVENRDTKTYELVLEQVVVQGAYDANAALISMGNEHALASMFTFCVEASAAEKLEELYDGKVAILKIR